MKKLTSIIITLAMLFMLLQAPVGVAAADGSVLPKVFASYVQSAMQDIKEEFSTDCVWDSDTLLSRFYVVRRSDDTPYSVVLELEGDSEPQGYIEVLYDLSSLVGFSFGDTSVLTKMLEYRNLDPDDYCGYSNNYVYFAGSYDFAVANQENTLLLLSNNNSISRDNFEDCELEYFTQLGETTIQEVEEPIVSPMYVLNSGHTWLSSSEISTLGVVTTNNFPTYDNHCTPTAGTNFIRFWYMLEGETGLWPGSNYSLFNSLYNAMGTNGVGTGTTFVQGVSDNGYTGLRSYAINRGCSPDDWDIKWRPTLAQVKNEINNGHPLMFNAANYGNSVGYHTVVCVGYSTEVVQILNGWTTSFDNKVYSSLIICNYYYIAYD